MNRNRLLRIVHIQDLVLEGIRHGATMSHIYRTAVYPHYFISYATFNRYLAYPAKRELRREEEEKLL